MAEKGKGKRALRMMMPGLDLRLLSDPVHRVSKNYNRDPKAGSPRNRLFTCRSCFAAHGPGINRKVSAHLGAPRRP